MPELGATTAKERRRAQAVGEHLVHIGLAQKADVHAAKLFGQVRSPQLAALHLGLNLRAQFLRLFDLLLGCPPSVTTRGQKLGFVRKHVLVKNLGRCHPNVVDVAV